MASELLVEPTGAALAADTAAERVSVAKPFVGLHGNASLDSALRTVLQTQTQLSSMADTRRAS